MQDKIPVISKEKQKLLFRISGYADNSRPWSVR